jgi:hypothetical protein
MKRKLFFLMLLAGFAAIGVKAQSGWPEMRAFKTLLNASYQPAQTGDLAPAKINADSLAINAAQWRSSAIPEGFNPVQVSSELTKLVEKCTALQAGVKANADDKKIKKLLTSVREVYLRIVGG